METKNKEPKKKFNAIKTMREIRDKVSLEIMDMTYEEERKYLDKLLQRKRVRLKNRIEMRNFNLVFLSNKFMIL